MRYDLYDDENKWVESSGACKICGQPTQTTTGVCAYRQPSFWQRVGIRLFNLKDYFVLVQRHAKSRESSIIIPYSLERRG